MEVHDATSEQVQRWNYHNNLDREQPHQIMMIEEMIEDLDIEAMQRSIEALIRRHESLRTCFRMIDGQLKQVIALYDPAIFGPSYFDIGKSDDPRGLVMDKIRQFREEMKQIDTPPLIKCGIFKIRDNSYFLCLLIHHLISDEWSRSLIYRDIIRYYSAFRSGKPVIEAPLRMQLKDYALWQKEWLEEKKEEMRDFWADKFRDLPGKISLVGGRQVRQKEDMLYALERGKAVYYSYNSDKTQYDRLRNMAVLGNAGILSLICASLQLLFALVGKTDKTLIASVVGNRSLPGTEDIIGDLVGGIYLYMPVDRRIRVRELLEEVHLDFMESFMNMISDHDELLLDGNTLRLHTGLYLNFIGRQIMGDKRMPPDNYKEYNASDENKYYALSCNITEYADGLVYTWMYNDLLFERELIGTLANRHEAVLQAMLDAPESTVEQLLQRL